MAAGAAEASETLKPGSWKRAVTHPSPPLGQDRVVAGTRGADLPSAPLSAMRLPRSASVWDGQSRVGGGMGVQLGSSARLGADWESMAPNRRRTHFMTRTMSVSKHMVSDQVKQAFARRASSVVGGASAEGASAVQGATQSITGVRRTSSFRLELGAPPATSHSVHLARQVSAPAETTGHRDKYRPRRRSEQLVRARSEDAHAGEVPDGLAGETA
eukprot:CAMPEP_0196795950 /NCGR_PEP_ID=MMETSP1104-20130614/36830_1 /TAXON_ID=33652 /ORGANISM="Cafeteria sp., Strain Caron Lab Isolate" /LENGTH=214 /DNA_ID=CAMNT_0042166345 /DNA_START=1 /DNA_END=642 /DNA_ORIENTATION=+